MFEQLIVPLESMLVNAERMVAIPLVELRKTAARARREKNPRLNDPALRKNIEIGETFNITAAQLKQNFDLAGTMATKVENSPEYSGYEGCSYQYPQTVCRSNKSADEAVSAKAAAVVSEFAAVEAVEVPEASNPEMVDRGHPNPGQFNNVPHTPVCYTNWVTRPGQRYVRYFVRSTLRDIEANFLQNGKTLGSFKGGSKQNETVYTYQSDCR